MPPYPLRAGMEYGCVLNRVGAPAGGACDAFKPGNKKRESGPKGTLWVFPRKPLVFLTEPSLVLNFVKWFEMAHRKGRRVP
ncbi:MAG: hypothetical protein CM15mP45_19090 [Deltaproteobacteria bacterium]|nr:MAG: hypothetical protein CM15mP45_19090 [Deltaproteobacteria bacterium]